MKSSLEFLGVAVPDIRREAKAYARLHRPTTADELIVSIDNLWCSGASRLSDSTAERQVYVSPDAGRQMEPSQHPVFELRSFAIALLGFHSSLLGHAQLDWLKGLIVDASCWGHVDWLSTEALCEIVHRDPQAMDEMDAWAKDSCFWVQRAAMLSLLIPLRSGDLTEWPRFSRYSVPLLEEKEFFIREAIGWVLRETSKKSPEAVRHFVDEHRPKMSGLTLREASKYL